MFTLLRVAVAMWWSIINTMQAQKLRRALVNDACYYHCRYVYFIVWPLSSLRRRPATEIMDVFCHGYCSTYLTVVAPYLFVRVAFPSCNVNHEPHNMYIMVRLLFRATGVISDSVCFFLS